MRVRGALEVGQCAGVTAARYPAPTDGDIRPTFGGPGHAFPIFGTNLPRQAHFGRNMIYLRGRFAWEKLDLVFSVPVISLYCWFEDTPPVTRHRALEGVIWGDGLEKSPDQHSPSFATFWHLPFITLFGRRLPTSELRLNRVSWSNLPADPI